MERERERERERRKGRKEKWNFATRLEYSFRISASAWSFFLIYRSRKSSTTRSPWNKIPISDPRRCGQSLNVRNERPSDRINVFVSKAAPVETRVILWPHSVISNLLRLHSVSPNRYFRPRFSIFFRIFFRPNDSTALYALFETSVYTQSDNKESKKILLYDTKFYQFSFLRFCIYSLLEMLMKLRWWRNFNYFLTSLRLLLKQCPDETLIQLTSEFKDRQTLSENFDKLFEQNRAMWQKIISSLTIINPNWSVRLC